MSSQSLPEFRYRLEIDFQNPDEWGIGRIDRLECGQEASNEEIAIVLETVASLLREHPGEGMLPIRYAPFSLPEEE